MGSSLGYDEHWRRDIGYGVPAICDHPDCSEEIDRGLVHVCADQRMYGGAGCGLYFCEKHMGFSTRNPDGEDLDTELASCCERCRDGLVPFPAKPDTAEWIAWKETDESWKGWREERDAQLVHKDIFGEDVTTSLLWLP